MTSWREEAACKGMSSDPFYPPGMSDDDGCAGYSQDEYDAAYGAGKSVCKTCPVRLKCLREAIDKKERFGLWGGLIPIERLRIERKARRTRLRVRREAAGLPRNWVKVIDDSR